MRVGFIGLGTMGTSIALNVIKGEHSLVVHDINEAAAVPHLKMGAKWAATPRKLAEVSEVVFTSLPGPAEVKSVAIGDDGILAGLSTGSAYFDLPTNSPTVIRALHGKFAENGVELLDAPVSGGPDGVKNGKMAIWVGNDECTFETFKPV